MVTPDESPLTDDAGAITHCEWCGVEFGQAVDEHVRTTPAPPKPTEIERAAQTHCQWCGVDYPQPT